MHIIEHKKVDLKKIKDALAIELQGIYQKRVDYKKKNGESSKPETK